MIRSRLVLGLAVAATLLGAQPSGAQNLPPPHPGDGRPGPGGEGQPQPPRKHHHSGIGAAIGAGVVGGLVGGALLNGQRQAPPPDYAPGAYAPPPPPPAAYEADDDEPVCRLVRKPVYDEDGEVVDYRTRRVCR